MAIEPSRVPENDSQGDLSSKHERIAYFIQAGLFVVLLGGVGMFGVQYMARHDSPQPTSPVSAIEPAPEVPAPSPSKMTTGPNGMTTIGTWKARRLSGSLGAPPSIVTHRNGLVAFVRDAQGAAAMVSLGANPEWTTLPGTVAGRVTPIPLDSQGGIMLLARGSANELVSSTGDLATRKFAGWTSAGGSIQGNPAVVVTTGGRLLAVARGTDKAHWWCQYDISGKRWDSWISAGGEMTADPALVPIEGGRSVLLFVAGGDRGIYTRTFDSESRAWSDWKFLGGNFVDGPSVAYLEETRQIALVGRNERNELVSGLYDLTTKQLPEWGTVPASFIGSPAVALLGTTRLAILVGGPDKRAYSISVDLVARKWTDWEAVEAIIEEPSVFMSKRGLVALGRAPDGQLGEIIFRPAATSTAGAVAAKPVSEQKRK